MKSFKSIPVYLCGILILMQIQGCMGPRGLMKNPTLNYPLYDAAPVEGRYSQVSGNFYSFDSFSTFTATWVGETSINNKFTVGAKVGFLSENPDDDQIEGQSGIIDPAISASWYPYNDSKTNIALGAWGTVPVGSEDINQGYFDFGVEAAGRRQFNDKLLGTASIGFDSFEPPFEDLDRESAFKLAGGIMYDLSDKVNLLAEGRVHEDLEFIFRPNHFSFLKGGLDFNFRRNLTFRPVIGAGLSEDSPDFFFEVKFLF